MASTSSKARPGPVSLDLFGQEVERRRQVAGAPNIPRNTGARRTASKQVLLKAIEDAGGKW